MEALYKHSCVWRYCFNASKSAVLVFGETERERKIGSKDRMFSLGGGGGGGGGSRVTERLYYDHVGIKTCVKGDNFVRTEEKTVKARRVLNMSTNMGFRKGGLNLSTCNVIFWSVIIPILCFGSEIWVLKKRDIEILNGFQRYAARRLQRLPDRSLNATCIACMGWMNIINYIRARQVVFIRSIFSMLDHMSIKRILIERVKEFRDNVTNQYDSPLLNILQVCKDMGLEEHIYSMARGNLLSKTQWKRLVWQRAWTIEQNEWSDSLENDPKMDVIALTMPNLDYSVWWVIADNLHQHMRKCEIMIKLICHDSRLKGDDNTLPRLPFGSRCCIMCEGTAYDRVEHMVMQCSFS